MLIAGIINILISILIFVTKQRVKQSASKIDALQLNKIQK